jgi:hypothetical protein
MGGKNFDRHGTIQAGVACTVNFSHATRTEHGKDFIRPEFGAGSERHRWAQL